MPRKKNKPPERSTSKPLPAEMVDSPQITWPDGAQSLVRGLSANQRRQVLHPALKRVADGAPGTGTFALQQNYPNPFNSATQIRFELDREGPVELAVFNLTGQRVATLVRGAWPAGRYAVPWDGGGLGWGVYLYRLRADARVETRKLLLLR